MAIQLGNIVSVGDKQVGSGIVSGLDSAGLIEGLVSVKQIPIDNLNSDIERNDLKLTKFNELKDILENFKTSVDFLRNPPGISNASSNIFEFRTTSLTSSALTTPESYATISADPGASIGDVRLSVGNIAKALSQRTDAFTSQTASITEAAGGTTAGSFSAGTFQLASKIASPTAVFAAGSDSLSSSEYSVVGAAGTSVITAEGINNITAVSSGDPSLIGAVTGISGTFTTDPTNSLVLSATVNGRVYTSNAIATNGGGGSDSIAANQTITFSNSTTETSFQIQTGVSDYVINNSQINADAFVTALNADLASQSIYQSREIGNFNGSNIQTVLNGLSSSNVKLNSNAYDTSANHGDIEGFTVTAPTSAGANDASLSTVINGETYQVTGLGQPSIISVTTGLGDSDYASNGTDLETTFTGGYTNITAGATGDSNLYGTISGFAATFNDNGGFPNNRVSFTVNINGTAYTAANVNIDAGTDQIATGAITFTDGDTSFDVTVADNTALVITDQATADTAAALFTSGLANYEINQTRELSNFDTTKTTGTAFDGISSTNILLTRDDFSTTIEDGTLGQFSITHVGVDDNTLSVSINGETYEATGLLDSQTANITLTSTTDTNNTLKINISDAGLGALDLSSQGAADIIAGDLNTILRTTDYVNGNLTLVNQTDNNKTLKINLADASQFLDISTAARATQLQAALNNAFGAGKLADITFAEGDSLQDIAANINSNTSRSGVSASIIQVSDTDFRLTIQSTDVGLENEYQIIDLDGVVNEVTLTTEQSAEDAFISINDIVISRSSNSITDAISGLTFNILKETDAFNNQAQYDAIGTPNEIVGSVNEDTATADSGIVNFVNAYNEFRVFAVSQGIRDEETGKFTEDSLLGEESLLQNLIRQVLTEINSVVGGASDSDFSALANIGITLTDFPGDSETPETSNVLALDPDKLTTALSANYNKLREIFEYTFTSSSTDFNIFSRTNSTTLIDYKVDIDTSRAVGNQVRILDLNDNFLFNADINGATITGQSGTTLEGGIFVYSGDGTDVITVHSAQGVADRLFNTFQDILKEDGSLDVSVKDVTDENSRIDTELDRLNSQIETFRQQLLDRFSALEAEIQKVNTLLDFLESQSKSIFSDS